MSKAGFVCFVNDDNLLEGFRVGFNASWGVVCPWISKTPSVGDFSSKVRDLVSHIGWDCEEIFDNGSVVPFAVKPNRFSPKICENVRAVARELVVDVVYVMTDFELRIYSRDALLFVKPIYEIDSVRKETWADLETYYR